jgi:SAM-dependent methyltransferase
MYKSSDQQYSHALEKLLIILSRKAGTGDYSQGRNEWTLDIALSILCRVLPDFLSSVRGMDILDYGSGAGYQSAALINNTANYVFGSSDLGALIETRALAKDLNLVEGVEPMGEFDAKGMGQIDLVISQNSMENFPDPSSLSEKMISALKLMAKFS